MNLFRFTPTPEKLFKVLTLWFFACSFLVVATKIIDHFDEPKLLSRVSFTYGAQGEELTKQWLTLLKTGIDDSHWNKLNKVNSFFNKNISYQSDDLHWGQEDYWASPVETLGRGGGDCEDFAIAKFFSLVALGVPEKKLRLMYVRHLTVNQPHMVLIYFEDQNTIPFVLDNYDKKIKPANKRQDLRPIYSFNGNGLWLARVKGGGQKIINSNGVSAWSGLIERIEQSEFNTYNHP